MSLLLIEEFAANPDWSQIPEQKLSRAQELINSIQLQSHLPRDQQNEEYYGWIVELKGMLET